MLGRYFLMRFYFYQLDRILCFYRKHARTSQAINWVKCPGMQYFFLNNQMLCCVVAAYLCFILASLALERVVVQVSDGDQTTDVTHVDTVRIGNLEETLAQELGGTVSNLTIMLHLSETQTSITKSNDAAHCLSIDQ